MQPHQILGNTIRQPALHILDCGAFSHRTGCSKVCSCIQATCLCSGIREEGLVTLLRWKWSVVLLHTRQALTFVLTLAKLLLCEGTAQPPCAVPEPDLSNRKILQHSAVLNLIQTTYPGLLESITEGSTAQPTYSRYGII